ncbi:MAG TPA: MarR family transcriptional regulator [Candidatus Limnocylindrales bacterium]
MAPVSEKQLLDDGFDRLAAVLREGTGLGLEHSPTDTPEEGDHDAFWQVRGGGKTRSILVEARTRFTPRAVDQLERLVTQPILRRLNHPAVMIVAPWLSLRSREAIENRGWNYLDLTGNLLFRSRTPAIYLRLAGADTDPMPRHRSEVLLRGSDINALVRMLVDVEPPYRLSDLAAATGLSKGYLSRALKSLHEQGLIERDGSGPVAQVEWPDLLRQRAAEYDLLKSNRSATFLARTGAQQLLRELSAAADDDEVTVTGSFAANRVSPVAAPAQLALYVPDIRAFARRRELTATRSGANVLLLEAASTSQLARSRLIDGVPHVGYSQLVQDLLAGNGRLPEEGEAVLDWMIDTPGWRLPGLPSMNN